MPSKLQELFGEYIEQCQYSSKLRPETIRSYKEVFKHFGNIMPEFDRPELLTSQVINEFFKRLQNRIRVVGREKTRTGIKKSTVKTYGSKLRVFFEWLVSRGHIKQNPFTGIKLPEPIYEDARALSRDSVEKIISAISSQSPNSLMLKRDTLMFYILLMCGLRRGELAALQLRDIDLEKEILTVRGETSKSKKTHLVPIHPTVMMHLKEYLLERKRRCYTTQYLIVSSLKDRELSHHGLKHWVERLKLLSGVNFHLHRFRHTFATNLGNRNTSVVKIQKLMGHADPKMTMVYLRSMCAEESREEINSLSIDGMV